MLQNIRKILIIRYSSMGDVILVAPLISLLHDRFPNAAIVLITTEPYVPLFKDDTRLSFIFGVKKKQLCSDPSLDVEWDIIIDLQNNRTSRKQTEHLRSSVLHRFDKLHMKRNLLLFLRCDRYKGVVSVPLRYIATIGETVEPGKLNYRIPFTKSNDRLSYKRIQHGEIQRPAIAFFPFSAWKNKEWLEEAFISVGHFFCIKGWNVVIFGGPDDRERALKMVERIGVRCVSLAGELDLYECGCMLRHCKLALGCDTGLSHLARACGVKCGFIFGPTTRHFGFQPLGDPDCRVFESKHRCRPCHPHGGNFCVRFDRACMKSIRPENVINGLLELYHG
jgi:heptosyltransferase II